MNYKKIILVDDNPTTLFYNQDVVSEWLPEAQVVTFENPNDFAKKYSEEFSKYNEEILVFLDINMPQKLGYDMLEELEETIENLDNLHVIMVTSSNLRADIEKSSKFPNVLGYIEKPLTVAKITNVLNGF